MTKKIKKLKLPHALLGLLALVTLLAFQNCSPGFSVNGDSSGLSSSSQASTGSGGGLVTPSYKAAAQTIGSASTAQTLTFKITGSNATLKLSVQNTGKGYSISNVSVVSTDLALNFSGLHVWLNDVESPDTSFVASSGAMTANSTATYNGGVVTLTPASIPSSSDTLAISFDTLVIGETVVVAPTPTPAPPIDLSEGITLYANYCANCHGSLNVSTKQGRSAVQISNAIPSISNMNFLEGMLTPTEISEIAGALQ